MIQNVIVLLALAFAVIFLISKFFLPTKQTANNKSACGSAIGNCGCKK